jgi:hypothetical protein
MVSSSSFPGVESSVLMDIKTSKVSKRTGAVAPGVAFVTGGARGLGNAIAVSFAREGARGVVIVNINPATLEDGKRVVEGFGTKVSPSIPFIKHSPETNCVFYEVFGGTSRRSERGRCGKGCCGCCEGIWEN